MTSWDHVTNLTVYVPCCPDRRDRPDPTKAPDPEDPSDDFSEESVSTLVQTEDQFEAPEDEATITLDTCEYQCVGVCVTLNQDITLILDTSNQDKFFCGQILSLFFPSAQSTLTCTSRLAPMA